MARRLKPARPTRSARHDSAPPPARPRRGIQLLVWACVLGVFCCLALLSGQTIGSGSQTEASAPPVSAQRSTVVAADQVLAAPGGDSTGTVNNNCQAYDEKKDFLPLNRWTSFSLFVVDNAWIIKTRLFISMIASMLFMAAALVWRLIGMVMGFSYSFDMVCLAAEPINSGSLAMAKWAGWFLIPAWLWVLAAAVRRWTGGNSQGPASALRLLMVFLTITGLIFFIGDQAERNQDNPTGKYTVPWIAAGVQKAFLTASNSLVDMAGSKTSVNVFYDNAPENGVYTCAGLDDALYREYMGLNKNTGLGTTGSAAMVQVSRIWEISFVRSWMAAQLGDGTKKYPSPAHTACRVLEANANVDIYSKLEAFDKSAEDPKTGEVPPGVTPTTTHIWRGMFIDPYSGEQTVTVAWAACRWNGPGDIGTIPQWDAASTDGKADGCKRLYGNAEVGDLTSFKLIWELIGPLGSFYFNGGDELNDKLGKCVSSKDKDVAEKCRYNWALVKSWLGANQVVRLTQSLMSVIVSVVFAFTFLPMAFGLMLVSVALAGLSMVLPLSLLMAAAGMDQGKRLLKLTGAAAAGKFIFVLSLTALSMLIDMTYDAIHASIGSASPNFFEQVAMGSAPLAALWLFKKIAKVMGLGDLSTMTGALGFAGAAALKATGDQRLSRDAAGLVSGAIGRRGIGRMRLQALDERSLQRRMVSNRATRAAGSLTKRLATESRVAKRAGRWWEEKKGAVQAGLLKTAHGLQRKALSGSPAQRAAAYAGLTAGMAALTALAPPSVLATLPLMAATGGAALGRGGKAGLAKLRRPAIGNDDGPGLDPGSAAGIPMAKNTRLGLGQADDWHRNHIRVSDPMERKKLTTQHTRDALDSLRAREWGAGHGAGLNYGFTGFVNDDEKIQALTEMAVRTGLAPERIMLGDHGLALPAPVFIDKRTGQRAFAPGTTIEQAAHPVHFLDRHTLQRQQIDGAEESDDQYILRLTAQLRDRGFVTDGGEFVDVFTAHGFDIRLPQTRERVAKFISGGRDEDLSKIIITSRRSSESEAVQAGYDWARDQAPTLRERQVRDAAAVTTVMEAASAEIGDFRRVVVERTGGAPSTAGELKLELDDRCTDLHRVVTKMQRLYTRQSSLGADEFQEKLTELTRLQGGYARDIDELSESLRDAVDASAAARGVCDLRVQLVDPRTTIDTTKVTQVAERITATINNRQQEWHEQLDKLAGGLYLAPDSSADADAIAETLEKLTQKIDGRITAEVHDNQDTMSKLEDMRQQFENSSRVRRSDPRLTSTRPLDSRDLIKMAYDQEPART